MRYLTLGEVVELHQRLLAQSGGAHGIRDLGLLESALFANHAFVDGNKRVGHAAMEVFLLLNDYEIDASVDEQEGRCSILPGAIDRTALVRWLSTHVKKAQ